MQKNEIEKDFCSPNLERVLTRTKMKERIGELDKWRIL
jgi:hypothetical protein